MISYSIQAADAYGHHQSSLITIDQLQAARAVNSIGSATLVVPDEFDPSFFKRDMRFKIYRRAYSGPRYLLGNTVWLGRKFTQSVTGKFWTISLKDANSILERPIIAYPAETTYAEKTILQGEDDAADNLMKAFVRENLGTDAVDTLRDRTAYLTVEENKGLGATVEKTASYAKLFPTLQALANDSAARGVNLYFDVLHHIDEKLIFKVYKDYLGADLATGPKPAYFGPQFKNLTDVELEWNYEDEHTVCYAGGMGTGAARLVVTQKDDARILSSPWGRSEFFIDVNDVDVDTVLQSEAYADLYKHTPKISLTANAIDTPGLLFGRNYFYGDRVLAAVGNLQFTCLISAFSVRYERNKEDLTVKLQGEL